MVEKYKGMEPVIDSTCYTAAGSSIIGNVSIGRNSSVWHNAVIRGDVDRLAIGENTNIQDCCVVHCKDDMETKLGNNISVGHGAILHSCRIGDNSLIGMGAVVLDGADIGKNCIIAAGSVVTPGTKIPDGSLVMGSPAKFKRSLTPEEIKGIKDNATEYVTLKDEYRDKIK